MSQNTRTLRVASVQFESTPADKEANFAKVEHFTAQAAAAGAPLYGIGAFLANQVLDVPKLKELVPTARALKKEMDELKRSPVGLLFAHKR